MVTRISAPLAYRISGACLALIAMIQLSWVFDKLAGVRNLGGPVGYLRQFLPGAGLNLILPLGPLFLTSMAAAIGLFWLWRPARGAALLSAWLMIGLGVREVVALLFGAYRDGVEGWMATSRIVAMVAAIVVVAFLWRLPETPLAKRRAAVVAGVLMLVTGVLMAAYEGYGMAQSGFMQWLSRVGANDVYLPNWISRWGYIDAAIIIALVAAAVLAIVGRRVSVGAGLAVLVLVAYDVWTSISFLLAWDAPLSQVLKSTELTITLFIATVGSVCVVGAVVLLALGLKSKASPGSDEPSTDIAARAESPN